jgi:hypothetical protein
MYNCCKNKVSFRVFRQALLKTMYDQVGQNLWCFLVPRQIVKSAGYYDLARVLELRFMGKYVLEFIVYFFDATVALDLVENAQWSRCQDRVREE